jgi:fucose permease
MQQPINKRATMAICCAGFFTFGAITAAAGPALSDLAEATGSSLASLGALFTAIFFGAFIAHLAAGPICDRVGPRPLTIVGLAIMAFGWLGVVSSPSLGLLLACAFVSGIGQGAIDIGINLTVAQVFAKRSAAALNLSNVFFGVGSFVEPAVVGLTLRMWNSAIPALWMGTALLFLLLPLSFLLSSPARVAPIHNNALGGTNVYRSPLLWLLGALVLLYVGIEVGLGGWLTIYTERTTALDAATAALVTSGFWLALTAGRVIAAVIGGRVAPQTLLLACVTGSLIGAAMFVFGIGSAPLTIAAALMIGMSFGPIFPTAFAITTSTFPYATGKAGGIIVSLGSLGGMLIPWFQGILLERNGPTAAMLLITVCAVGMLALFVAYRALGSGVNDEGRTTKDRFWILDCRFWTNTP